MFERNFLYNCTGKDKDDKLNVTKWTVLQNLLEQLQALCLDLLRRGQIKHEVETWFQFLLKVRSGK